MAFPASWPPRPPSGVRSIRFYATDTATADFADRAYLFIDGVTTLKYLAQVGAFTEGEVIVGQTSGATATIFSDADAGLTGVLTLVSVVGVFDPSEQILGNITGDATTDGTQRHDNANTFTPLPTTLSPPTLVPAEPFGTGTASGGAPSAMIWAQAIRVCNDGGGTLEYSFDGTNVQGKLLASQQIITRCRPEAGIAIRGAGASYRLEAW